MSVSELLIGINELLIGMSESSISVSEILIGINETSIGMIEAPISVNETLTGRHPARRPRAGLRKRRRSAAYGGCPDAAIYCGIIT
jgi:hypothetical protein